jgi:hypothetical protein
MPGCILYYGPFDRSERCEPAFTAAFDSSGVNAWWPAMVYGPGVTLSSPWEVYIPRGSSNIILQSSQSADFGHGGPIAADFDLSGRYLAVAWSSIAGDLNRLRVSVFDTRGGLMRIVGWFLAPGWPSRFVQINPVIAGGRYEFVVVYERLDWADVSISERIPPTIAAQRISVSGQPIGNEIVLNSADNMAQNPDIDSFPGSGHYVAVWEDRSPVTTVDSDILSTIIPNEVVSYGGFE